jgi:LPS O-antigen subunit length determinant protein (WzzB/FepE family)
MVQNSKQPSSYEDEIDLLKIIKILMESKKLIILTILIFTIGSIIFSLSLKPEFKSSSILEIGYYEMPDGTMKLIEKPSETVSNIRKNLIYKNRGNILYSNITVDTLENNLLHLQITSKSSKKNLDILSEITNYIDANHSNLSALITKQEKNKISLDLESVNSRITFVRANNQLMLTRLEEKITQLKNQLPIIDLEISQLEKVIIEDTDNLNLLKETNRAIERAASSPTLEQIISSYKSRMNDLKREKNIINSDLNFLSQKLDALKKNTTLFQLQEFDPESDKLFSLEKRQKVLENQLQKLISQPPIKTTAIGDIQTETFNTETRLIISWGIILGFFTSFLLIFIRNFVKKYKLSQA